MFDVCVFYAFVFYVKFSSLYVRMWHLRRLVAYLAARCVFMNGAGRAIKVKIKRDCQVCRQQWRKGSLSSEVLRDEAKPDADCCCGCKHGDGICLPRRSADRLEALTLGCRWVQLPEVELDIHFSMMRGHLISNVSLLSTSRLKCSYRLKIVAILYISVAG